MAAVQHVQSTEAIVKNATCNYTSSALHMKRTTTVLLSTLTYIRGIFPDEAYTNEKFRGMRIKLLKDNPKSTAAKYFKDAIKAIFEAFDKKYLRRLVFSIYGDRNDPMSLIECYLFNYKYNGNDTGIVVQAGNTQKIMSSLTLDDKDAVLKATKNLLRMCTVMADACDVLPPKYDLSIQLYYYDDVTPPDYEPKGFVPLLNDTLAEKISEKAHTTMGRISTNFHKLKVQAYQSLNNDHETEIEDNPMREQVGGNEFPKSDKQSNQYESTDAQASASYSDPVIAMPVRCPCNQVSAFERNIIMCRYCEKWQHSVCFGILPNQKKQIEEHCCEECAQTNAELKCSCETIMRINNPNRIMVYCLVRRALILCTQHRVMNASMLRDILEVDTKTSLQMMRKLVKINVFKPISAGKENNPLDERAVNMTNLNERISHFFQTNELQTKEVHFFNHFPDDLHGVKVIGKMIKKMDTNTGQSTQSGSMAAFREIVSQEKLSQERHPSDIMESEDLLTMQLTSRNLRSRKRRQKYIEECPSGKKNKERHPSDIMKCKDHPMMQPTSRNLRPRKRRQEYIEECPSAKKNKVSFSVTLGKF